MKTQDFTRSFLARITFLVSALAIAVLAEQAARAQNPGPVPHVMKGTVPKYQQPLGHLFEPNNMMVWGEDIPSDVDWHSVMMSPTIPPNWVIADDFRDRSPNPVLSVRWWGSYTGPTFDNRPGIPPVPIFGPGSEDGYVISFFRDIPADPTGGAPFSRPGELLGTYVLPLEKVWIDETPYIGWHDPNQPPTDPRLRIWEYKANLMDAHLDHASDLASSMGFNQKPGEIYWISIMAEVGHRLRLETTATGEVIWVSEDTGKFAEPNNLNPEGHFWGWHTSPRHFNDIATMGHLAMPGNQWEYFGWQPIQPRHGLFDMAFELYTVPEPATFSLIACAVAMMFVARRK